jgi:CBS domain-containing protein
VIGSPVTNPSGERLGRVVDLIIRLGEGAHPPVAGVVAKIGGRELFIPIWMVASLGADGVQLTGDTLNLGRFERRPGEVLLAKDLSARHLIHLVGARLVRANEIELGCIGDRWQVVGVDSSSKPVLRRLLPRRLRNRISAGKILDWADIEPFVAHVPTARLRIPFRKLARLHPAQLADLVEAASHEEGEEIIQSLGEDRELEADVFEELDPEHQVEFLNSRSDAEAARILARMGSDDAADLIVELDQDRRMPVLQLLPPLARRKVSKLLSYNPETAGGLMNPDFISLPAGASASTALARIKSSPAPPEAAGVVYVTGESDQVGRLQGTVPVVELLRADPSAQLADLARPDPVALQPDADIHEIVRKMTDFNLAVVPVVDDEGTMLGQITVDDVLELLLPAGWRRQYGMDAAD